MTNKANISIVESKKGTEIVLSGRKTNKKAWISAIGVLSAGIALFWLIHGKGVPDISLTVLLLSLAVGIEANQLLHYLLFGWFSPEGFRSVSFIRRRGGIRMYHCHATMRMWQYRIVCLTPVVLLGIIPFLYGMINGYLHITELGMLMFLAALDDVYILWQLRSFGKHLFILDYCKEKIHFQIDGK